MHKQLYNVSLKVLYSFFKKYGLYVWKASKNKRNMYKHTLKKCIKMTLLGTIREKKHTGGMSFEVSVRAKLAAAFDKGMLKLTSWIRLLYGLRLSQATQTA